MNFELPGPRWDELPRMRRLLLGSAALCCLAGSRDARVTRHVRPGGADATVDPWPGRAAIPSPSPGGAPCRWVNVTYPGVREFRQCVRPAGAGDLISDVVARDGRWRECDALVPLWRETADEPAGLFVDVGANIGACALPLLRLGARTLAFEPLRVNLAYLTRSALANGPMRWFLSLYAVALGSAAGEVDVFSQRSNRGNSVVGRAFDRGDARTRPAFDAYRARVATLDDVLWPAGAPPPPPIRLMKVDVQGFEPRVFDGAARLLAAGLVRVVKFELAPDYLAAVNGGDAAAGPRMLAALEARGFVLESAESGCARSRAAKAVVCDREVVARLNRTRARRSNPGRPS